MKHTAKRRNEHLPNGSAIYWSRKFVDRRGRYRVPVRCGRCGEVRKISTVGAQRQGFTGLCPACAALDRAFQIPRSTLERLYCDEGLSQRQIAERLGCGRETVRRRMKEYDIEVRRPPRILVPEEVLREWSPELAYVVGLVATDGCLKKGSNRVSFPSTDYELIENYQQCLGVSLRVYTDPDTGYLPLYRVILNDPAYRAFLEEVGLTPAKTKDRTLGPFRIPDEYFRDFLRGVIDGDGSIGVCTDRRYPNSRWIRVGLTSVCRSFLVWIRDTVTRLAAVEGTIYPKGTGFRLVFTGRKVCRLLSWLYYAPDLPCLHRKRDVWEAYMRDRS